MQLIVRHAESIGAFFLLVCQRELCYNQDRGAGTGTAPPVWIPSARLGRLWSAGGLFLVGLFGQLVLKIADAVLELLDLDLLALVFTGQPFDDLASVGHLHASFPPVRIQRGCPGCDYSIALIKCYFNGQDARTY